MSAARSVALLGVRADSSSRLGEELIEELPIGGEWSHAACAVAEGNAARVHSTLRHMEHELGYLARPDGVTLAYGRAGQGPPLLLAVGWTTHLEWFFSHPATLLAEPLAQHLDLITFDKHGTGMSDRDRTDYSLESEVNDVAAVADHLGLERFSLMGMSEGGLAAQAYAAKHPDRVDKLVLYSTTANGAGLAQDSFKESFVNIIRSAWGFGSKAMTDMIMPDASREDQEAFIAFQRQAASADVAADLMDALYHHDTRPLLGQIEAPTLIIHRRNSRAFPLSNGRQLAAGIPNSRAVIFDGVAHFPPTPGDPHTIDVVNEILDFLVPGAQAVAVRHRDSAFRTVMFTDVEASTALVDRLGDTAARDIMRRHEVAARRALAAHGGTEIKTMGDGLMVSFNSASAALDTAIALQREIAVEFPDGDLQVRIGINAGEPIAEDDDLHGTAVIRASRIMDVAGGGEVMVSSLVRELVAGRDYRFEGRGLRNLKGFEEPVPVFELDWRHQGPASTASAAAEWWEAHIGEDPGPGEWFEIGEGKVAGFGAATLDVSRSGDVQPMFLLSLLTYLVGSIPREVPQDGLVMGINYGFDRVRFGEPLTAPSRVRARSVPLAAEVRGTSVNVITEIKVEADGRDEPVLNAVWVIRGVYAS